MGCSSRDLQSLVVNDALPGSIIGSNSPPYVREIALQDPGYLYYYLPFLVNLTQQMLIELIPRFTDFSQFQRELSTPRQLFRASVYAHQRVIREILMKTFGIIVSAVEAEDMLHHLRGSDPETLLTGYGPYGTAMASTFDTFRETRMAFGDEKLLRGLENAIAHKGVLVYPKDSSIFACSRITPEDECELLCVTDKPINIDSLAGICFLSDLDRDAFMNMQF